MSAFDIVTFGSATVDIHVQTRESDVSELCSDNHCEPVLAYKPGDKVLLDAVHTEIGGGGTNTAACLKRLGRTVGYCGAVGEDAHGEDIISWLAENDISFLGTRVSQPSNLSIILDSLKLQDRTILAYKGSSDSLRFSELHIDRLRATWWYFSSLLGEAHKTMLSLMRYARTEGIAIAFNPSSYQVSLGREHLQEAIQLSQFFICNKEEAETLVGPGTVFELARRIRSYGGEIVVVTDGSNGAVMLYANTLYHVPSCAKNIVETTGAGDCFSSTILYGLMKGYSPADSLVLAAINAEHMITIVGAKNGLLTEEELSKKHSLDTRKVYQEQF